MRAQLAVLTLLLALAPGCGGAPAANDAEVGADVSDTPKPVSETPNSASETQKPPDPVPKPVSETSNSSQEHPFSGVWAGTWAGVAKIASTGSVLKFKGNIELTVGPTGALEGTLSGRAPTFSDYELSGRFSGQLSAEGAFDGEYSFRGSRHNPHAFEGELSLTAPDRAKGHLRAPADRVDETPSVFKVTLERGGSGHSPKPSTDPTGHSPTM